MSLKWIDPALDAKADDKIVIKPQGETKCTTCGKVSPFKDIYFDHCKHCVSLAHK